MLCLGWARFWTSSRVIAIEHRGRSNDSGDFNKITTFGLNIKRKAQSRADARVSRCWIVSRLEYLKKR